MKVGAGILLLSKQGKVLLCHATKKNKKISLFDGSWTISKGEVDEGESLINAALRELKEETNIDLQLHFPELYTKLFSSKKFTKMNQNEKKISSSTMSSTSSSASSTTTSSSSVMSSSNESGLQFIQEIKPTFQFTTSSKKLVSVYLVREEQDDDDKLQDIANKKGLSLQEYSDLKCNSMIDSLEIPELHGEPEMDDYVWVYPHDAEKMVFKSQKFMFSKDNFDRALKQTKDETITNSNVVTHRKNNGKK